jgi:hypothetical protein
VATGVLVWVAQGGADALVGVAVENSFPVGVVGHLVTLTARARVEYLVVDTTGDSKVAKLHEMGTAPR